MPLIFRSNDDKCCNSTQHLILSLTLTYKKAIEIYFSTTYRFSINLMDDLTNIFFSLNRDREERSSHLNFDGNFGFLLNVNLTLTVLLCMMVK